MILKVFSVRDQKAEAYLNPIVTETDAVAIRMFDRACRDETHDFHQHAEDYILFKVGEFDRTTGELIPILPTAVRYAVEAVAVPEIPKKVEKSDLEDVSNG